MRITVVASMRNEGPFIVEWVTWYRMLGFTEIVVVTNNCTDRSPELLDALQAAGWLHHLRCDIEPGQRVTHRKLAAAAEHKAVRRADWLLVCDVDEFLVIHKGKGQITDLIGEHSEDAPFLAMAVNWRVFGFIGNGTFEDHPVHRQFSLAVGLQKSLSNSFKMLHRQPRWFERLAEHGPRGLNLEKFGRSWNDPGMVLVNAKGETVPNWNPQGPYMRRLRSEMTTHEVAQMNHYMLRSEESFSLKRGTASPVALSDRYTDTYARLANNGIEPDFAALDYAEAFDPLFDQAMALPNVRRLHKLCCADHLRLIAEKNGRRVEDDPRWHAFLAEAAACT